jgi:hypothetical protein
MPCSQDSDCTDGPCIKPAGVCCDSPCGGVCEQCDLPDMEGACLPKDPGTECALGSNNIGHCDNAKQCTSGAHQWTRLFSDGDNQRVRAMAMDGAGNLYVTGYFTGNLPMVNNGPGMLTQPQAAVIKYDTSGVAVWVWALNTAGAGESAGTAIAVHEATGDVYLTGHFQGTVTDPQNVPHVAGTVFTVFVAQLGQSRGNVTLERFTHLAPADQRKYADGLCLRGDDIVIAGTYADSIDWPPAKPVTGGGTRVFIAQLARETFTHDWIVKSEGAGGQWLLGLACSTMAGRIVAVGGFDNEMTVGGQTLEVQQSSGFALSVDADGKLLALEQIGNGNDLAYARSVAIDPHGNLAIAGLYATVVSYAGSAVDPALDDNGVFLALRPADGGGPRMFRLAGVESVGDIDAATPLALEFDSFGNLLVAGAFVGNSKFLGVDAPNSPSDVFVAKIITEFGADISAMPLWVQIGSGASVELPFALAAGNNSVAVAGDTAGAMGFVRPHETFNGNTDGFVSQFSP